MGGEAAPLTKVAGDLVHLDQGTYQWVDIKRFHIDQSTPVPRLVSALVASDAYNDDYAGGDEGTAGPGLHGPYRQAAISVNDFVPITAAEATDTIGAWASQFGAQTDDTNAALDARVFALFRDADQLLALGPKPDDAQHEWGWVVGQAGFHEFVAIDRGKSTLSLIVASDD